MFWSIKIAFKKIQLMPLVNKPALKQYIKGNGRYSMKVISLKKAVSVRWGINFM
jgi:hypothetical protein